MADAYQLFNFAEDYPDFDRPEKFTITGKYFHSEIIVKATAHREGEFNKYGTSIQLTNSECRALGKALRHRRLARLFARITNKVGSR